MTDLERIQFVQDSKRGMGWNGITWSVPLPDGTKKVVVNNCSGFVKGGDVLAIMGPSGCGKSSLLRVIAGLWPASRGHVSCVPSHVGHQGTFFLPQRPYFTSGSLREQVLYPLTEKRTGKCDEQITSVLELVGLGSLLLEWGLDGTPETGWRHELAAGTMQALGFARALFHTPAVCFMDEATSAIDATLEARLLGECRQRGISMVAVCHRASALGFHDHTLSYSSEHTGSPSLHTATAWEVRPVSPADIDDASKRAEMANEEFALTPRKRPGVVPRASEISLDNLDSSGWAAISLLARMSFQSWTDPAALCVYVMLIADGGLVYLIQHSCHLQGKVTIAMASYGATGQVDYSDLWFFYFFSLGVLVLFSAQSYASFMLSLHVRHVLTNRLHAVYFSSGVLHMVNASSRVGSPDQRIQQDLARLQVSLGSCGFTLANLMITMALAYAWGFTLNWFLALVALLLLMLLFCLSALTGSLVRGPVSSRQRAEGLYRELHATCRTYCESITFYQGFAVEAANANWLLEGAPNSLFRTRVLCALWSFPLILVSATGAPLLSSMAGIVLGYSITDPSFGKGVTAQSYSEASAYFSFLGILGTALIAAISGLGELNGLLSRIPGFLEALVQAEHRVFDRVQHATWQMCKDKIVLQHVSVEGDCSGQPLIADLNLEIDQDLLIRGPSGSGKSLLLRVIAGLRPSRGTISRPQMHADTLGSHGTGGWLALEEASTALSAAVAAMEHSTDPERVPGLLETAVARRREYQDAQAACHAARCGDFCLLSPQSCYLTEGTLREQIIYPETTPTRSDEELAGLLDSVGLSYLLERRSVQSQHRSGAMDLLGMSDNSRGLDTVSQWQSTLSGGEQQRLALTRILYQCPTFALMDEATSALNAALEAECLRHVARKGVKMIHVSHRATVVPHHSKALDITQDVDGSNAWAVRLLKKTA